jgi:hypothetical protein
MVRDGPDYLSYLLRLWVAHERGRPVWRASLQSPHTGERVSFCTLEELFAFLRRQTGTAPVLKAAVPDSSTQECLCDLTYPSCQDDPAEQQFEEREKE